MHFRAILYILTKNDYIRFCYSEFELWNTFQSKDTTRLRPS
jgi:hypothetical protein